MSVQQQTIEVSSMKKYVQGYGKPDDRKALMALGISFALEAVAIALIHLGFGVMGWTLHTLTNLRFFMQYHDMAHFSFFSSIPANIWVGKLIGIYTHFPFNAWRDGHNHHHKHFGNLDRLDLSQTILFTKKQYDQMKGIKKIFVRIIRQPFIFFFITIPFVWFFGIVFTTAKRYGVFSLTLLEKLLSIIIFTWVCPMMGIPAIKPWAAIYFASIVGNILFHLQHSVNIPYRERNSKWNHVKAALEGSTFLSVHPALRLFTNGIQYHHIHHLNTNVASYVIDQCHDGFEALSKDGHKWDEFKINRVGIALAWTSLFNVMLDEENSMLVPFDYF